MTYRRRAFEDDWDSTELTARSRSRKFTKQYADEQGREYEMKEDGVLYWRIPRKLTLATNRGAYNDLINAPEADDILHLTDFGTIRVEWVQSHPKRPASGLLGYEIVESE
jgi:hypothetical protein